MAISPPIYNDVRFYLGDPAQSAAPYDVKLRRQSNHEVMTRMGTPVLIKHRFNIEDVEKNVAIESATMDDIYKQSRYATDEVSHGVGYVSVETQAGEWYDPKTGTVYITNTPDPTYLPAPTYRGYGPGYLTYAILPDRPEDTWKLSEQGALIRQQQALAQLPWYPTVGDNDLVIICDLDNTGRIAQTFERYQLRMVSPITMRGNNPTPTFRSDWSGYREPGVVPDASGNRWWVGQQAEMVYLEPFASEQLYHVEVDR